MAQGEGELVHRTRPTPLSWAELQSIVLSSNVVKLARSEDQSKTYRRCMADIKRDWQSIYDYLLCTKFGFEWVWADAPVISSSDDDGKNNMPRQKRSMPTFQQYLDEQSKRDGGPEIRLKLCTNDFPYYFVSGVDHYVLWKLGGVVTPEELANAKMDILKVKGYGLQGRAHESDAKCTEEVPEYANDTAIFLHWVNPPHLKSLPGIDHVHILYRNAGTSHL
ncbi:hypothetical protein ACHAXT_006963 [Thalassiosira profunda]